MGQTRYCFTDICIKRSNLYNNPMRYILLSPFFRSGNWHLSMFTNLSKVTQLVYGWPRIQRQALGFQNPCSTHCNTHVTQVCYKTQVQGAWGGERLESMKLTSSQGSRAGEGSESPGGQGSTLSGHGSFWGNWGPWQEVRCSNFPGKIWVLSFRRLKVTGP